MSCSGKVLRTFVFSRSFGAAEKIHSRSFRALEKSQEAAEKNKEKLKNNYTDFSAEFFGSQSVEMFCFARQKKIKC